MRASLKKAALVLLPVLAHTLVIPSDQVLEPQYDASSSFTLEEPSHYGGPSTFFEYVVDDNSIKFTIPCPECSDEEKELLKKEIISVKPTLQSTEHCAVSDPIGLEINGQQVISNGASDLTVQSYIGPLYSSFQLPTHHIFNRTRVTNYCGCPEGHLDGEECTGHFESLASIEILGLASGHIPGFTLSYKQYGAPELLRLSTFPDTGIAKSWSFGQSAHYLSPRLRPQRAASSISTSIPPSPTTTSLPSPSSSNSASSPSHTYSQLDSTTNDVLASTILKADIVIDRSNQASLANAKVSADRVDREDCDRKIFGRCILSSTVASLRQRLGAVSTKVKSGTQAVLGKFKVPDAPQRLEWASAGIRPLGYLSDDVNMHDELDGPVSSIAHDELDDSDLRTAEWQSQQNEAFYTVDSSPTFWDFDRAVAIKAFQVTSLVFIIVAFSASIFALVRRNPRLRAQWATVLEERRNRRLYRVAARKQRFQDFFDRFRLSSSVGEKASIIPTHHDAAVDSYWGKMSLHEQQRHVEIRTAGIDGALGIVTGSRQRYGMQSESGDDVRKGLQAFRKVHQFVDNIISAEEGRSSSSRHIRRDHFTNRARAWSIGSEKTAPPAYDSESEDVIIDANGNTFMVIGRDVVKCDRTPGSSIISTSPRTSCADSDSEPDEKF